LINLWNLNFSRDFKTVWIKISLRAMRAKFAKAESLISWAVAHNHEEKIALCLNLQ
jgi:hypothetical protein